MKHSILTILFSAIFCYLSIASEKVTVTTDPQTARIYVNGILTGTGKIVVTIPKGETLTVEVRMEGYVQETRTYSNKKNFTDPPSRDYIQLQPDESYTSTILSDVANNELVMNVKAGRTKEEAWKIIVNTILNKFDVLENNDATSGYLRTSWVGATFRANTIRTRLIVKLSSEEPLVYKIKFVSEASGKSGTSFSADEQYKPFNRILKTYDGFLDELMTKLKN
jgi:hypothetical protein